MILKLVEHNRRCQELICNTTLLWKSHETYKLDSNTKKLRHRAIRNSWY